MKSIGLFGGTFNPIHSGHLHAARRVRELFNLDNILFIPSFIPPHKGIRYIAEPCHRLEMVKRAVGSRSGFEASSIEIDAAEKSYSILTLEKIKKEFPGRKIYFILGIDAFMDIASWKEYDEVLRRCIFIVLSRPGYDLMRARHVLAGRFSDRTMAVEGNKIPDISPEPPGIYLVRIDALDISSTDIRDRIRSGKEIHGLVPEPVEEYIRENRLYHGGN